MKMKTFITIILAFTLSTCLTVVCSAQDVSEEQKAQLEKINKSVNKSGTYFKDKEYKKSAGQIREALRLINKLDGGDEVAAMLEKDYARIVKAQQLLKGKGQKFDALPELADLVSSGASEGSGSVAGAGEKISFVKHVAPIVVQHCGQCHIDQQLGRYSMESFEKLVKKSRKGEVVKPKDIDSSRLISLVESGKMPKQKPKLADEQIQVLKDWISQGARFDGKSRDKKMSLKSFVKQSEGSDKH